MEQVTIPPDKPKWNGSEFYCEICGVTMTSKVVMDSHLQGSRHKSVVKRLEEEQRLSQRLHSKTGKYHYPGIEEQEDGYHCKYCDCICTSTSSVETHVKGQRHRQKLYADEFATQITRKLTKLEKMLKPDDIVIGLDFVTEYYNKKSPELRRFYSCALCSIRCKNSQIMSHLLGTEHRLNMMKDHNPSDYEMNKSRQLPESSLSYLAEDWAFNFKRKYGMGLPTLKPIPPPVNKSCVTDMKSLETTASEDIQLLSSKEEAVKNKGKRPRSPQPSTSKDYDNHDGSSHKHENNNNSLEDSEKDVILVGEYKRKPKILSTIDLVNDNVEESPPSPPSKDLSPAPPPIIEKESPASPPPSEMVSKSTAPLLISQGVDPESCLSTITNFKSRSQTDTDFLLLLINTLQAHYLNYGLKDVPTQIREMLVSAQIKKFNNSWFDVINKFVLSKTQNKNDTTTPLQKDDPPDLLSSVNPPLPPTPPPQPPLPNSPATSSSTVTAPHATLQDSTYRVTYSSSLNKTSLDVLPPTSLETSKTIAPFPPPSDPQCFIAPPPPSSVTPHPAVSHTSFIPPPMVPLTSAPPPNIMTVHPSTPHVTAPIRPFNIPFPPPNMPPFPPCTSVAPPILSSQENSVSLPTKESASSQFWNPPFPMFPPWSKQLTSPSEPPS